MKYFLKIVLLTMLPFVLHAQQSIDSLKNILAKATNDSVRYAVCKNIYDYYEESNRDSALKYAELELMISQKNNEKLAEVLALNNKGYQLTGLGRYADALQCLLQAFKIAEDPANDNVKTWTLFTSIPFAGNNRLLMLAYSHHIFAILMWQTGNQEQEIFHFKEARRISEAIQHSVRQMMADMNLGRDYLITGKLDSAIVYEKEAEQLAFKSGYKKFLGNAYSVVAKSYFQKGNNDSAKKYFYIGIASAKEQNNLTSLGNNLYFALTKFYLSQHKKDSALSYALKNLQIFQSLGPVTGESVNLGTVYQNIYQSYQLNNQIDSAYKYQGLALNAIDSLNKIRIKNLADFQNVNLNEQLRLQNIEKEKIEYQNKIRTYFFLAGIFVLLLLAIIFYRNNRQKHKAKLKIEKAYDELKTTQRQLVQSEKMASLGELTAGIAHEIQNPLNFVNNFSEVSRELIEELKSQMSKLKTEEQDEILNDIDSNLEKINHHGKRADAIVKGMLQHSRKSTGQKEFTDINDLCDEYLRLSYHGLRAKDKSFNAKFETDFDLSLPKINVVAQDIGRVILNLINNAFYAAPLPPKGGSSDSDSNKTPTVWVSTKKEDTKILISVRDNGPGIPKEILDKIFQPFFTTKPTGQGTGLGLSLSYDMVKAHGGEIKVETEDGEGTEFTVSLPF